MRAEARALSRLLVLLALFAPPAPAMELGTLLTTPQERERLDRLRRGEPEAPGGAGRASRGEVTGFVKRSDGRGTVWIDGSPLAVDTRRAGKLLDPDAVRGSDVPPERLRIEHRSSKKPRTLHGN